MTQEEPQHVEPPENEMNGASDADGEAVEGSEETPTPYSQMAGRTVSGKIVVLSMAAIVVAVVVAAQVWLGPAQKKLNSVYRKQKRMDSCMAKVKSNRLLSEKAKQAHCKRQAARRARAPKLMVIPTKTPNKTKPAQSAVAPEKATAQ